MVVESLSRVRLFATTWTAARQAPLSMGFSKQENKWVATPSSRGIFSTQELNWSLLHGKGTLRCCVTGGHVGH